MLISPGGTAASPSAVAEAGDPPMHVWIILRHLVISLLNLRKIKQGDEFVRIDKVRDKVFLITDN